MVGGSCRYGASAAYLKPVTCVNVEAGGRGVTVSARKAAARAVGTVREWAGGGGGARKGGVPEGATEVGEAPDMHAIRVTSDTVGPS